MNKKILVVNAGSSSIKWKLFNKNNLDVQAEGIADRIFVDGLIETKFSNQKQSRKITLNNHGVAVREIANDLQKYKLITDINDIEYIGHRVVQGGTIFNKTTIIDEQKLSQINDLSSLAPLHNPGAVEVIKAMKQMFPHAQNTATFDTAFHTSIPKLNFTYPINYQLAEKYSIRKYGAHGTSHKYITYKLAKILKQEKVTFVNLHIGNGASLCAVKDSQSFDTSMGLTPLAGIMMGTRSGDIDPSIHAYICQKANISIQEFEKILNKESGLKGVSGVSQDMRDIFKAIGQKNQQAQFAFDLYAQKIVDYTVQYINKLKKPEAIVFTAGVGENVALLREKVIQEISPLNLEIDHEKNNGKIGDFQLISTAKSQIPIYVIRTNEELMIAQEALAA